MVVFQKIDEILLIGYIITKNLIFDYFYRDFHYEYLYLI